jgi:hypothetical protein
VTLKLIYKQLITQVKGDSVIDLWIYF